MCLLRMPHVQRFRVGVVRTHCSVGGEIKAVPLDSWRLGLRFGILNFTGDHTKLLTNSTCNFRVVYMRWEYNCVVLREEPSRSEMPQFRFLKSRDVSKGSQSYMISLDTPHLVYSPLWLLHYPSNSRRVNFYHQSLSRKVKIRRCSITTWEA